MLGSSTGVPHLCTSGISTETAKNWVRAMVQNFSGEPPKFKTLRECMLGNNMRMLEEKKKRREKGIFNLYPILIFQKLILSLWNKPLCLKSLWKPRQLPQSLRHCLIPLVPKLPRGNLDGWLLQIHRHGEVWDAGFQGVSPLGYTGSWNMRMWVGKNPCVWELPSSPAGFPNSGSPSSLLIGWRKLGSIIQLENSEFRSQVPQNFYPVAPGQLLQGDEKQLELRKGTSLIGGTWWLCRWLWASLLSTILG